MEGVEYVGSVGQEQLAHEFTQAAALSCPSTFAETSGIAVTEAMAAGAAVLTTRRGALPEAVGPHATMIEWTPEQIRLERDFTELVVHSLQKMRDNPEQAFAQMRERREFIRSNYLWVARAKKWSEWLDVVVGNGRAGLESTETVREYTLRVQR